MNWKVLLIIAGIFLIAITIWSVIGIGVSIYRMSSMDIEFPPMMIVFWFVPFIVHLFAIVACFGGARALGRSGVNMMER